jgi:hypothetical protein
MASSPSEVSTMGKPLVLLLLVFWIFLAYRALERGDIALAALFGIVGVSLTVYRLRSRSGGS